MTWFEPVQPVLSAVAWSCSAGRCGVERTGRSRAPSRRRCASLGAKPLEAGRRRPRKGPSAGPVRRGRRPGGCRPPRRPGASRAGRRFARGPRPPRDPVREPRTAVGQPEQRAPGRGRAGTWRGGSSTILRECGWGRAGAEPELSERAIRPDTAGRRRRVGSPRAGSGRTPSHSSAIPSAPVEIRPTPTLLATRLVERTRHGRFGAANAELPHGLGPRGSSGTLPRGSATPEQSCEEPAAGLTGVAGAALRGRDTPHDLVDVLAAARPGRLATPLAGNRTAHRSSSFMVLRPGAHPRPGNLYPWGYGGTVDTSAAKVRPGRRSAVA